MRHLSPLAVLALVAACSSDAVTHPPPAPPEKPAIVARFDPGSGAVPAFLEVPWPSDVYLEADGTVLDEVPGFGAYFTSNAAPIQAALGEQRGFGLNTGADFRIDRAAGGDAPVVDAGSLPKDAAASVADTSSVFLVDLDAKGSAPVRVPCRAVFHDDRDLGTDHPPLLAVLPARGVVLAEGHKHAVVLTTKVTADGGKALGASDAFAAIRDGDERATPLEKLYGDAVDAVAAKVAPLADKKKIAGLAVFTTQDTSGELLHMREIIAGMAPPELSWAPADLAPMGYAVFGAQTTAGYTATLDDWLGTPGKLADGSDDPARDQTTGYAHDALAVLGTAVFEAPNFLLDLPGGYADPKHANVARDAAGLPAINPDKPTAKVWVSIALPRAPMPAGGFPVVILQHGLQDDRSWMLMLANTYAEKGIATVAIESVTFGARAVAASDRVDMASTFHWSSTAKYSGPDGFVDHQASAISFFGSFLDFGALRDQMRQSVIDLGTLADMVRDPSFDFGPLLAAVPGARFDPARVGYTGDSLGAIMGAMVASVEPNVSTFVLNVGGGGIMTEMGAHGPALAQVLGAGALAYGLTRDRLDDGHPFLHVLQGVLDPADPLTHAHRVVRAPGSLAGKPNPKKNVVLIESIWDELVCNEGNEALAAAMGLPLVTPNAGSNAGVTFPEVKPGADGAIRGVPETGITAVLVQASPATHGQEFYYHQGHRHFAIPFVPGNGSAVLPADIPIKEPYVALQAMAAGFLVDAFAGAVPGVKGFPTPHRDFDDDGVDDAMDAAPLDPSKH